MTNEGLAALRDPFDAAVVGKLPKGGVDLDYVGHAAVTDRLLNVDPEWDWEPLGVTPEGLPALDKEGNLWIRLTVCGVTRIGVGDGATMKIRVGDALRNAAMRFGVALYLWTKDELESTVANPPPRATRGKARPAPAVEVVSDAQLRMIMALMTDARITERSERLAYASAFCEDGRTLGSSKELTKAEASKLIESLQKLKGES